MKAIKYSSISIILLASIFILFFSSCSLNTIFNLEKNPDPTLNNTCTISGYILDRQTKAPLIGANVVLSGITYGAATDINGFFSFDKIPPGKYEIRFSYIGYRSYSKSDVAFEGNYKYIFNVELVMDYYF